MGFLTNVEAADSLIARLSTTTVDGRARAHALTAAQAAAAGNTPRVAYQSSGDVLILERFKTPGDEERVIELGRKLGQRLRCTVLIGGLARDGTDARGVDPELSTETATMAVGELARLGGHLGAFAADIKLPEGPVNLARYLGRTRDHFDLVLDLTVPPHLRQDVPPLGYYAPAGDQEALARAVAELPEMIGEFEKPRYFRYDPDICVHGSSGIKGCTRCLDVCPTLAIHSIGDKIEVDPYLCQGVGACATACPTGAITYDYPAVGDLLAAVKTLLQTYRDAGGRRPSLLFHDGEAGGAMLATVVEALPERVIPIEVEEIGSVGMDSWLAAVAYGASHVLLLAPPTVAPSVKRELTEQLRFARAILEGIGYAGERLKLVEAQDGAQALAAAQGLAPQPEIRPASFVAVNEKRTMVRMAVDHLYPQADTRPAFVQLPARAPFGEIRVDRKGCTLCMACASVCPHSAVTTGGDLPQLLFDEWNCVQCGLCASACPEKVITLAPRFIYDPEMRRATRTLNEEAPFCCVVCGKPFATQSMLRRMQEKLKGHWMFQNPAALRRMEMCEDCRVKDMFLEEGLIDVHKKPEPRRPQ